MRTKIIFCLCGFLAVSFIAHGQALGTWKTFLPYKSPIKVTQSDVKVFCSTTYNLYSVDKEDNSVEYFDKTNGLSDVGVSAIEFNPYNKILFIAYTDGNIDLMREDKTIVNISDFRRNQNHFDKTINGVTFIDDLAYVCTNFGIFVLDMSNDNVKDTWVIDSNSVGIKVFGLTDEGTRFYAATAKGIKEAAVNDQNLADYNEWTLDPSPDLPTGAAKQIDQFNGSIFTVINDTIYKYNGSVWDSFFYQANWKVVDMNVSGNKLVITQNYSDTSGVTDGRLMIVNADLTYQFIGQNDEVILPSQAVVDGSTGITWAADPFRGLVKIQPDLSYEGISPNSPYSAGSQEIKVENDAVWVAAGSYDVAGNYTYDPNDFYRYQSDFWTNFNAYSNPELSGMTDFVCVAVDKSNSNAYLGSYRSGIIEYDGSQLLHYDDTNSSLQPAEGDPNSKRVAGLALDDAGNLWVANSYAIEPIVVKKADGTWKSFPIPGAPSKGLGSVVIDDLGRKWFILRHDGLIVYDDNGTIDDPSDDRFINLHTGVGEGNLPSDDLFSIAKDLDGQIWIGTSAGVAVFYCPDEVFDNPSCVDAQQIIVETDGIPGYLLEHEQVNAIAVDGANRKWVATDNGIWLFSPDGVTQVQYFNKDNSPLLSNSIKTVAINQNNGEVWMGTDFGLIVYRGDATEGSTKQGKNVQVFPNPVMEDYTGMIAINGLVQDADVRITDISGTLIYQTKAQGGEAVWNGKGYDGARAHTGVYLVFSSDDSGKETFVAKILFFN